MLSVKKASEFSQDQVRAFFGSHWDHLPEQDQLYEYGRFVEMKSEQKGFFALFPIEKDMVWLRSLYLKEGVSPTFIMTLIETITVYAEREEMSSIIVFSHDLSTDTILKAHQFKLLPPNEVPNQLSKRMKQSGKWWLLNYN